MAKKRKKAAPRPKPLALATKDGSGTPSSPEAQTSGSRPAFVIRFALICLVAFAILQFVPESAWQPANKHTARALAATLKLAGVTAVCREDLVSGGGFAVRIVAECTVLLLGALFACFVNAFPATWKMRLAGLAAGLPALYLLNHLRLVAVYLIGIHHRDWFDVAHVYFGQVAMVLATLGACVVWLRVVGGDWDPKSMAGFCLRFAILSIPLCWAWVMVNRDYVGLIDGLVERLFALFHYRFQLKREHAIYYQTFNLITIVALVGASDRMTWKTKGRALAAGLGIAVVLHLSFRILNLMLAAFGHSRLYAVSVLVTTVGQYLLPLVVYFGFAGKQQRTFRLL